MERPCPLPSQDLEDLIRLRHELHAWPEIGFEEHQTSARVRAGLEELGLQPRGTGTTGLVVDTRPDLPVAVALRADMDALPMEETGDVPWRSRRPGFMHGCGHDGHTAILLGTARALVRSGAPVNVRLLFQPAEEGGWGALELLRAGALVGVPEVYGLHNWPTLGFGRVGLRAGAMMAASDRFNVVVRGRGGHGSQPHLGVDPILAAAHVILALQSVVSRRTDPLDATVVSLGSVQGGTTHNVIPEEVRLQGTARALDDGVMERIAGWVAETTRAAATSVGARAEVEWIKGYPVTRNHPVGVARVQRTAVRLFGEGTCTEEGLPSMGAEDMSCYLREVPGAYFFLGSASPDRPGSPLHSPTFDFDDRLLPLAIALLLGIVEDVSGVEVAFPVPVQ